VHQKDCIADPARRRSQEGGRDQQWASTGYFPVSKKILSDVAGALWKIKKNNDKEETGNTEAALAQSNQDPKPEEFITLMGGNKTWTGRTTEDYKILQEKRPGNTPLGGRKAKVGARWGEKNKRNGAGGEVVFFEGSLRKRNRLLGSLGARNERRLPKIGEKAR